MNATIGSGNQGSDPSRRKQGFPHAECRFVHRVEDGFHVAGEIGVIAVEHPLAIVSEPRGGS